MSSQVLALHRVSPRRYDLSGVRTGSVRDQLLRSAAVVDALATANVIGRGFPLIIYGAGAAGINAAIMAAARHIDVTVVEVTNQLFSSILGCRLRRIDPTEYDWPHKHWKAARCPLTGTIALPQISAMNGAVLAAAFTRQWDMFVRKRSGKNGYGKVTLLPNLDAFSLAEVDDPADPFMKVTGRLTAGSTAVSTQDFGARLSCIGHGTEQVSDMTLGNLWNGYAGPQFWSDADGMYPGASLPAGVRKILISGAGDGGMQDFQRAVTSYFGHELLGRLELAAAANPAPHVAILPSDELLKTLMSAEETARRAFGWAPQRNGVPQTMAAWHDAFMLPIAQMVSAWPRQVADHVAKYLFRTELLLPDPELEIRWIMREPMPGYAYALNRYLSLLLWKLAERVLPGRVTVSTSSVIHSISAIRHSCSSAATCIGKRHDVRIDTGNAALVPFEAELIIIRHGVEFRRPLPGAPLPVPEQMSPFDLPL